MCFDAIASSVLALRRQAKTLTVWKQWKLYADKAGNISLHSQHFSDCKHGKIFGPGRYNCAWAKRTAQTFANNAPTSSSRQGAAWAYHRSRRGFYARRRGKAGFGAVSDCGSWLGYIILSVRIQPKDVVRANGDYVAAVSIYLTKAAWRQAERYAKQALKERAEGAASDA